MTSEQERKLALIREKQRTHALDVQERERAERAEADNRLWLEWSGGRYPDTSPGDVIDADVDGTIILDDGIVTWNPLRALTFLAERAKQARD